jgi:hypothetical protein
MTREDDGSVWKLHIRSYHCPYAAAYSLMALAPSVPERAAAPEGAKR